MDISLDRLRLGQQGTVERIHTDPQLTLRLRAFGMIPGTQVRCRYRSPGGSVTALEFCGTVVALRTRDIRKIRVRC